MTEKQSGIRLSLFPMEMKLQIQPGAANKISPAGRKFPYSEFQVCMNATGSVSILKGVGMFPRKVTRGVMLPLADGEIALQPAEAVFSLGKPEATGSIFS